MKRIKKYNNNLRKEYYMGLVYYINLQKNLDK